MGDRWCTDQPDSKVFISAVSVLIPGGVGWDLQSELSITCEVRSADCYSFLI